MFYPVRRPKDLLVQQDSFKLAKRRLLGTKQVRPKKEVLPILADAATQRNLSATLLNNKLASTAEKPALFF